MSAISRETAAIWPGYVAAIASLVLSLLLLLAILVFAMTQVSNIVASYTEQLMRAVLDEEARKVVPEPTPLPTPVKTVKPKASLPSPEQTPNQVRFVFEADLASIPTAQANDVFNAITNLHAPSNVRWLISATTPPDDDVAERATYRLMLALRRTLVEAKIPEQMIDMRIDHSTTAPRNLKKGAIAINVAPVKEPTQDRQKP